MPTYLALWISVLLANAAAPDVEFLEFLADWSEQEQQWLDSVLDEQLRTPEQDEPTIEQQDELDDNETAEAE